MNRQAHQKRRGEGDMGREPALDPEPGSSDERSRTLTLRSFRAELLVLLMVIVTFGAVAAEDRILTSKTILTPANATTYNKVGYADEANGGNSSIIPDPERPLAWTCILRNGYDYAFCGYELVLDPSGARKGLDLSQLRTIAIDISYAGPGDSLRLHLSNRDPRYSGDRPRTEKINKFEFTAQAGRQTVVARPGDFTVADWWLIENNIPPELSRPQFDNIVGLEIQTDSVPALGEHRIQIHSITIDRWILAPSTWHRSILAFWALVIGAYVLYRILSLKRDIQARRRQEAQEREALQLAKSAAESASKAKSEFLANMSHELRTPLNAILGYAQLLERTKLDEQQCAAVGTIRRSGNHLLTLITDILDLSKIEAGKLEIEARPMDLHACVAAVGEMMRLRAQEKELGFECLIAADAPQFVSGDEKRLRQVLINLVSNAVKFTSEGQVTLCLSGETEAGGGARIRFEVRDSGPGIAPDELALIFRPFEQVGDAARRAGGTGLGLSISRQIVEHMGGELEVESEVGRGSRFWFELRFQAAEAVPPVLPAEGMRIAGKPGSGRRLLVVDDVGANRAFLADSLGPLGFEIAEAATGTEALERAQSGTPDLVLMDIRMPGMDGLEAMRRLRCLDACRTVPVIALSADVSEEARAEALAAGASAFLPKPVDHDALIALVVRSLGLECSRASERDAVAPHRPRETLIAPPADQMDRLMTLALAGNMRAIRQQAEEIAVLDPKYRPFSDRLQTLARSYQSPAILRLIEDHSRSKTAA